MNANEPKLLRSIMISRGMPPQHVYIPRQASAEKNAVACHSMCTVFFVVCCNVCDSDRPKQAPASAGACSSFTNLISIKQCQIGDNNVETDCGKPQLLTLPWQATVVSRHVGFFYNTEASLS